MAQHIMTFGQMAHHRMTLSKPQNDVTRLDNTSDALRPTTLDQHFIASENIFRDDDIPTIWS